MQPRSRRQQLLLSLALSICASATVASPGFCRTFNTFEQVLEDIDAERYQDALQKLKLLIVKNPADAEAHAELGRLYMDVNQFALAAAESTRAIQLNPKLERAYATRSYCEFQMNRMNEGFADSEKVLKLYMVNPLEWSLWHTHKNRAQAYKMLHRNKEYLAEKQNEHIFDLLEEADHARDAGQLDQANQKIDIAIKLDPKIADLWLFKGVIENNQNNTAAAINAFNKAIALAPNAVMLYYFRGDAYQQLGKHQQAIDDFTRIIKAKPSLVAYRFVCETGRLRNELMRDDTSPISLGDVYVLRAQSYAALKKPELAHKDLEIAAKLDPTDDKAIAKKAELTLGTGKYDAAIREYTTSVEANPKDWTRYKERADAYMQVGKSKEALADYSKVIELTPKEPGAYMLRALALKSLKKYDQAISDFSKILQLHSDDDDAYMERADCYRLMHRYKDALADLDKAAALVPSSNTFVREARAKVLAEMNGEKSVTDASGNETGAPASNAPASNALATNKPENGSASDQTADIKSESPQNKAPNDGSKNILEMIIIGAVLLGAGLFFAKKKFK